MCRGLYVIDDIVMFVAIPRFSIRVFAVRSGALRLCLRDCEPPLRRALVVISITRISNSANISISIRASMIISALE